MTSDGGAWLVGAGGERYRLVETPPRPGQFAFYGRHPSPFYSLTWEVSIGEARRFAKAHDYSTHLVLCYLVVCAMQRVEAFLYGFLGERIARFEHLVVGTTLPAEDGQFAFADLGWHEGIHAFIARAREGTDAVRLDGVLRDGGRMDMVLLTSIPGVRFTSMTHVPGESPFDARPRVGFGRFVESDGESRMPIGLQVHHAFVSGQDLSALAGELDRVLADPEGAR